VSKGTILSDFAGHIGKSKILRPFIASFAGNPNRFCIMNATNNCNRDTNSQISADIGRTGLSLT
jgi:hypothetical protein